MTESGRNQQDRVPGELSLQERGFLKELAADHLAVTLDLEMARHPLHGLTPFPSELNVVVFRDWAEIACPVLEQRVAGHREQVATRDGRVRPHGLRYVRDLTALAEVASMLRQMDASWGPLVTSRLPVDSRVVTRRATDRVLPDRHPRREDKHRGNAVGAGALTS